MERRVLVPNGFEAEVSNNVVSIAYNDKKESKSFRARVIEISKEGNEILIKGKNQKRKTTAIVNTTEKCIENIILGLKYGYEARMKIVHVHFPTNVQISGREIVINNFLGEKKPRKANIVGENTTVELKGKEIVIKGTNKEHVGQTAANIEKATKITKKDLRIFQDSIYLVQKTKLLNSE
ncbi:MAG: 50S ribosomal protein L6 [Candidatus Diapherotrites archaeon]|nr:50S ribosomal protein L6 [Candidatus Diapherotrites archaeon]